jgi:alkanesulfonate monooxygenase SsuD/methylene tetrahydromethanopterin reductase-like flavin-dependent oxidoreductase (luciferase family)
MASQWKIAEDTAAQHGTAMNRKDWRIVVGMHIAEDDEEALRQVRAGERQETTSYFEETLGRVPGTSDDPLRDGVKALTTLVGSPETAIRVIERLQAASGGGFGARIKTGTATTSWASKASGQVLPRLSRHSRNPSSSTPPMLRGSVGFVYMGDSP